jgi:hypothetical protein
MYNQFLAGVVILHPPLKPMTGNLASSIMLVFFFIEERFELSNNFIFLKPYILALCYHNINTTYPLGD